MNNLLHDPQFKVDKAIGGEKVISLEEAIGHHIKPGMMIHTGQTGIRWCSAIYFEMARQFWNRKADWTLVGISMNFPQSILVHGGLVKKIITSYCGDPYYTPSPNRVYQRAYFDGVLDIENWSIYSLPLRLQAAALDLPYLPTRSLIGSTMEQENQHALRVVQDDSGSGRAIALVKALEPDISVIHGWLADPDGNAVFLAPLGENLYGAMASREGVVLTVEKIVPPETIRKYSYLTKLPGTYVRSVTEVPLGAHPSGMCNLGLPEMEVYGEDYEFIDHVHQVTKSADKFQEWIDEWVLSCNDHEGYLKKLGYERILRLKGQSQPNSWKYDLVAEDKIGDTDRYSATEMAVVAMARILEKKIKRNSYRTLLAGAGMANLGAWLCYYNLKKEGITLELMAEVGMYGYVPQPADPALFNLRNFNTCRMTTDIQTVMGLFVGGRRADCIGALGAAQVDEKGNINSTLTGRRNFIVGSGGANDVASTAREVVVIVPQSKQRLVESVYYRTSPGHSVGTVVTTHGVFEKYAGEDKFTLTGCYGGQDYSLDQRLLQIHDRSG
ncbi:MAG: hypothetical protein JJV98_20855, partial [Desulfosarcina sp.]|nr:hypothetical protein [Desulfobacterales bacterium]